MEKKFQINIYRGLPMVLEKINTVAMASVIGKGGSWINNKYRHNVIKGRPQEFIQSDVELINNGLPLLGDEILGLLIVYNEDRESVIEQIRNLRKIVSMPYVYNEVMKKDKRWFERRMQPRKPGGKACSFKEDDILRINMGAMQVANELKSIEFTL